MNRFRYLQSMLLLEADGGGAAAAATPPAAAAPAPGAVTGGGLAAAAAAIAATPPAATPPAGDGTPPAATPPAAAPAAAPYYPEGLADTLRGKTDRETLDNLAKHVAQLPRPPEKADGYAFNPADAVKDLVDAKNDKVLPLFRKIAHAHNLDQKQFDGVINGLYAEMMQAGLIAAPVAVEKEFQILGGTTGDKASQMAAGVKRMTDLSDRLQGFATRGTITKVQAEALIDSIGRADQVIALETILQLLPASSAPRPGGSPTPAADPLAALYPSMAKTA